jgi:hypothetical protein
LVDLDFFNGIYLFSTRGQFLLQDKPGVIILLNSVIST